MAEVQQKFGARVRRLVDEHHKQLAATMEEAAGREWLADKIARAHVIIANCSVYLKNGDYTAEVPLPAAGVTWLLKTENMDLADKLTDRFVQSLLGSNARRHSWYLDEDVVGVDRRIKIAACEFIFKRMRDAAKCDDVVKRAISDMLAEFLTNEVQSA